MPKNILASLNPPQREAVKTTTGPVLIIAGAGSGKTKALTHRVAYLILEKNVSPRNILAVTFTNKAASEMRERIIALLATDSRQPTAYEMPNLGTFHSICARILRREIEPLGYKKDFTILDSADQLSQIKKIMKELEMSTDQLKPTSVINAISKAKNELIGPTAFAAAISGYYEELVSKIYSVYQQKLQTQSALDFDDLIMLVVRLFEKFPAVLEKYQNLFRYIMVDEYQDTNHAQYMLVSVLAKKYRNLCVVGDDWQGIYSWRGANIQNILDFEKDYPEAKVIKLEQNYRSTQNILDAAFGVISKNIHRKDKKIWTENKGGHLLTSFEAENETAEADFVIQEILEQKNESEHKLSDFVVLYRTNAQSRVLEEAMLKSSVPYRIIGSVKFYQRKEIKDIVAYLRLINNFQDEISLERIINEPRRGIGEKTLEKWTNFSKKNQLDLIGAGLAISKQNRNPNDQIIKTKADSIVNFCEFILRMTEKKNNIDLPQFIEKVFCESGYEKFLLDGTEEGQARQENVRELLTVAQKYAGNLEQGLRLFLEEVALASDTDNINQAQEAVHLMTLHSAKGLEFRTVFIVGLEEGILPHSRSMLSEHEMEEERRLMYVGLTRAKEKVYLLFTRARNIFGSSQINAPSRFLEDIPTHLISRNMKHETYNKQGGDAGLNTKNNASCSMLHASCFKDGERIRHEVFGDGLIISVQGDTLTVAFSKAGLKKLSAAIAPLEKL